MLPVVKLPRLKSQFSPLFDEILQFDALLALIFQAKQYFQACVVNPDSKIL